MKNENKGLIKAKELITGFLMDEYLLTNKSELGDTFDDMENIPIAYTTTEDDEQEIQVNADLINFKITTYLDDVIHSENKYSTLQELIDNELKYLAFDNLVSL